jgi:hypothetical protein
LKGSNGSFAFCGVHMSFCTESQVKSKDTFALSWGKNGWLCGLRKSAFCAVVALSTAFHLLSGSVILYRDPFYFCKVHS